MKMLIKLSIKVL